jgi:ribonuclease HI
MKPTPSSDGAYDVYIDGASRGNPGPAGIGAAFFDAAHRPAGELAYFIGETTNNVAEYLALIYALQHAQQRGLKRLAVKTDSELLAHQTNGIYRVREPQLKLFQDLVRHLWRGFEQCAIVHVPRERNTAADRLANRAIDERRTVAGTPTP